MSNEMTTQTTSSLASASVDAPMGFEDENSGDFIIPRVKPVEFKVGDRVVTTARLYAPIGEKGLHGTVRAVNQDGWPEVEFDEYIGGHDLKGKCIVGHGWVCPPDKLEVTFS